MKESRALLVIALTVVAFGAYLVVANLNVTLTSNGTQDPHSFDLVSVKGASDLNNYRSYEGPAPPSLSNPENWRRFASGVGRLSPPRRARPGITMREPVERDGRNTMERMGESMTKQAQSMDQASRPKTTIPSPEPEINRHSKTNIQEAGIDEPDIVKTDGHNIYYAGQSITRSIRALPIDSIQVRQRLKQSGDLLHNDQTLIQLSSTIDGFSLNDGTANKRWSVKLPDKLSRDDIKTARLVGDKLIVVFQDSRQDLSQGCPLMYFDRTLKCRNVLRPNRPLTNPDSLFVVAAFSTDDGAVLNVNGIVGQDRGSAVYASSSALYLAYTIIKPQKEVLVEYAMGPGANQLPGKLVAGIQQTMAKSGKRRAVQTYGTDIMKAVQEKPKHQSALRTYVQEQSPTIVQTGIAKFNLADLAYQRGRALPGHLLNQFSMDEHNQMLRVATTVEGFGGRSSSSRVTVLNKNFNVMGAVTGLGTDQRIYAVRFLQDRGYVVTFRRRDPFYIIDLSDPNAPRKTGKLKMPGFSSYLHPIDNDRVIGIGKKTDGIERTKVVLFDVSNNNNPRILSRMVLKERKSAVDQTHHAFLHDPRHNAFFLPAGDTGYVFGYEDDTLTIHAQTSGPGQAKRAAFINNYLYTIASRGITVLNEETWETERVSTFPESAEHDPDSRSVGKTGDLFEKLQELQEER